MNTEEKTGYETISPNPSERVVFSSPTQSRAHMNTNNTVNSLATAQRWLKMPCGTLRRTGPIEIDVFQVCIGPQQTEWRWRLWGEKGGFRSILAAGEGCEKDSEAIYQAGQAEIEHRLRAELHGSAESVLWGPSGLIAATMRCVDAVQHYRP